MVKSAVSAHSAGDPQRDGDQENQQQRKNIDPQGQRQALKDLCGHRPVIEERIAEVKTDKFLQPQQVLHVQRLVQTVEFFKFQAHIGGNPRVKRLLDSRRFTRGQADNKKADQGNTEEQRNNTQ